MRRLTASLCLAAAAVFASPGTVGAITPTVCLTQVEASGTRAEDEAPRIDEKLQKMRKRLPGRFALYRFLGQDCWVLEIGDSREAELPTPYRMQVSREEDGSGTIRVRWRLLKKDEKMNESVAAFKNHGFLWVGGPRSAGGDLFVLLHAHWE